MSGTVTSGQRGRRSRRSTSSHRIEHRIVDGLPVAETADSGRGLNPRLAAERWWVRSKPSAHSSVPSYGRVHLACGLISAVYTHSNARNVKHVRCCRQSIIAESALTYVDVPLSRFCWSCFLSHVSSTARIRLIRCPFFRRGCTPVGRWLRHSLLAIWNPRTPPEVWGCIRRFPILRCALIGGIWLIDFLYVLRLDGLSRLWLIAACLPSGRAVCLGRTSTVGVHRTHTAEARMSVHLRTTDVNGLHRPIPT